MNQTRTFTHVGVHLHLAKCDISFQSQETKTLKDLKPTQLQRLLGHQIVFWKQGFDEFQANELDTYGANSPSNPPGFKTRRGRGLANTFSALSNPRDFFFKHCETVRKSKLLAQEEVSPSMRGAHCLWPLASRPLSSRPKVA